MLEPSLSGCFIDVLPALLQLRSDKGREEAARLSKISETMAAFKNATAGIAASRQMAGSSSAEIATAMEQVRGARRLRWSATLTLDPAAALLPDSKLRLAAAPAFACLFNPSPDTLPRHSCSEYCILENTGGTFAGPGGGGRRAAAPEPAGARE